MSVKQTRFCSNAQVFSSKAAEESQGGRDKSPTDDHHLHRLPCALDQHLQDMMKSRDPSERPRPGGRPYKDNRRTRNRRTRRNLEEDQEQERGRLKDQNNRRKTRRRQKEDHTKRKKVQRNSRKGQEGA